MADPKYVEIRGGIQDGVVYLRAADVVNSLRVTAEAYREYADADDEMAAVMAGLFESEADEFDLLSMRLEAADLEDGGEVDLSELDEESDG